jgi:3-oxoacyl-[acyl-carrier-protein] synthase III
MDFNLPKDLTDYLAVLDAFIESDIKPPENLDDLEAGDTGLICSFGVGHSTGTVFVRKAG